MGVVIGVISVIFIYFLVIEMVGLVCFLIDIGMLIVFFLFFGFGGVMIKFFLEFKIENGENNGMFLFVLSVFVIVMFIFVFLVVSFCVFI